MLKKMYRACVGIACLAATATCFAQAAVLNQPVLTASINRNAIVVPVTIHGTPYHFLLDTGASFTMIDNRLAAAITQPVSASQIPRLFHKVLQAGASTVSGNLSKDDFTLWSPQPMALGNYVIPGSDPWLGQDMGVFSQVLGRDIDGILGIDIFRQLAWTVDNNNQMLAVWQHAPSTLGYQHCVPYSDGYNRSPELEIDFPDDWVQLRIDTGADITTLSHDLLQFLATKKQVTVVKTEASTPNLSPGGVSRSDAYLVEGLHFNGTPLGRLAVGENKHNINNLGMNFLRRFDNYLFIPNKMLLCYNAAGFTRDEKAALRRISVRYVEERVELFQNDPETIARLGLRNGDVLVAVNDQQVRSLPMEDIREMLAYTPSGALTLVIERNGDAQTLKL